MNHIFVAFIAYCLQVTFRRRLRLLAAGLMPRAALEKVSAIWMVDIHVPTTDPRVLVLPRYTDPDNEQKLLLSQLRRALPEQPTPRIRIEAIAAA